jgi:hypothetical protein
VQSCRAVCGVDVKRAPFENTRKLGMKTKGLFLIGCILVPALFLVSPSYAQQSGPACHDVEYFAQTGHNVCDQFLEFFSARGGADIFGYPITEAFVENGRLVQYFQRVRMEHHPALPPAYHVQLGLLGDHFAPAERKTRIEGSDKPKSNDPHRRYFPETGHTIQFAFQEFFSENGGLDNFGYPVTEFFHENGRFVQYFQRALMEWEPNRNSIVLANLGEMWVDQHPHLRSLGQSAPQLAPSGEGPKEVSAVSALQASASVRDASVAQDGEQTVWVYVYDQNGAPVEGAGVMLLLPQRSGWGQLSMDATDAAGHTRATFGLEGVTPGEMVIIDAVVTYQGLTTRAKTFFLVWL